MLPLNVELTAALKQLNDAVHAITLRSRQSTLQERQKGIEFLAARSANPDVIKIFADALRRFGHNLTDAEKIRIADILRAQENMPPITAQTLRDSLEKIIINEKSPRAGAALRAALEKVSS